MPLPIWGGCQVTGSQATVWQLSLPCFPQLCPPLPPPCLVTPTMSHCHLFGSCTSSKGFMLNRSPWCGQTAFVHSLIHQLVDFLSVPCVCPTISRCGRVPTSCGNRGAWSGSVGGAGLDCGAGSSVLSSDCLSVPLLASRPSRKCHKHVGKNLIDQIFEKCVPCCVCLTLRKHL